MNSLNNEIDYEKKLLNSIMNQTEQLEILKQATKIMKKNEDFMCFISNTNLGNELFENWQSLVNLISNDLYTKLSFLNKTTYNYLSKKQ